MCGIVGYKGKKNVKDILISGLETLEYRGYDSSGVAIHDGEKVNIVKSIGKIVNLKEKLKEHKFKKQICGIAHTRWATHGKVTEENSHPHKVGRVTLVHNGIIENYKDIEEELKNKYEFKTETDTEKIAALIDSYYDGDNEIEAIEKTFDMLKGSYALAVIFDGKENIYGVKKDAPLLLGIGEDEYFLSSDISAILEHTKEHIVLEDNEIVEISEDYKIYYEGILLNKDIQTATWNIEEAQKNGYDHFMLKEIEEQEELSKKLYAKYIEEDNFSDSVVDLTKYKKVDLVGCGSAYHASLIAKYFADKYISTSKLNVNCYVASEYRYQNHYYDEPTLVILFSQSGETADTLACLRMCNENNVDTLAVVNVISSTIARESKYVMPMLAGPEICVATTKGYFAQSYICSLIMLKYIYKTKGIDKKELLRIFEEFRKLEKNISKVIKDETYKEIAKSIYKDEDIYYIGRGIDLYSCYEASLKLKEISYIHSECFASGELKHGPIALISDQTPVISILTELKVADKAMSNIIESSSRGAKTIVIKKDEIQIEESQINYVINVPTTSEYIENLLIIVACQLLAYEVAKLRGCDIDKPRNLAKSVTVE